MFDTMDLDKNGKIDKEELRLNLFLDEDHDGFVSEDEVKAYLTIGQFKIIFTKWKKKNFFLLNIFFLIVYTGFQLFATFKIFYFTVIFWKFQ